VLECIGDAVFIVVENEF